MTRLKRNFFPLQSGLFALLILFLVGCADTGDGQTTGSGSTKQVQVTLKDIRNKQITYDFYQVRANSDLEYVATEVADKDGQTVVTLELDQDIQNIIVKRTKNGVEKRQVVPLRSNKVVVQFLL